MGQRSAPFSRADAGKQTQQAGTRRPAFLFLMTVALLAVSSGAAGAAELLMFTRKSCAYCILWERQVGPIYPKTAEAEQAPLRRVDLDHPGQGVPSLSPAVTITPTFVLMDGDKELGRFSGYSDDLTFWSVLATHLGKLRTSAPLDEKSLQ
jgi:hypothetical protein